MTAFVPGGPPGRQRIETMTSEEFGRIAALLRAEAGIVLAPQKASMAHARLAKRMRALGLASYREYCDFIESRAGAAERREMLNALTTNVTRFYREPHHFEELRDAALPPLIEAARKGQPARIWSAGCSTGEEPYTIAMTILSLAQDANELDIRILATDINPLVVETGRRGVYPAEALEPAPKPLVGKYFQRMAGDGGEDMLSARDPLRQLIVFRELNLMGPWPFSRSTWPVRAPLGMVTSSVRPSLKAIRRVVPRMASSRSISSRARTSTPRGGG